MTCKGTLAWPPEKRPDFSTSSQKISNSCHCVGGKVQLASLRKFSLNHPWKSWRRRSELRRPARYRHGFWQLVGSDRRPGKMSLAADLELGDSRVEFIADYVLKTMKLKPDKWTKMYSVDENKGMFTDFFERNDQLNFLVSANAAGVLSCSFDWPSQMRAKACYFVKKRKEPITKDTVFRSAVLYGDLSSSPIDQLSAFVDEVRTLGLA